VESSDFLQGMLASAETVDIVADALRRHGSPMCVIDPVMVSTSGAQLLSENAVRNLREGLLPLATVLTPNIPEAKLILANAGLDTPDLQSLDDIIALAKSIQRLGPKHVLVKGGHLPLAKDHRISRGDADVHSVADVLHDGKTVTIIESSYLKSKNTHGTGCSLASAIASNLALGHNVRQAVRNACRYVQAGISTSIDLGRGSGPINHFHSTYILPFAPGRFLEYLLERFDVKEAWKAHTEHEFIERMADGTLPLEKFKYYLIQDYLFLVQFARAKALGAYKSKSIDSIAASSGEVLHVHREMSLHLDYCKEFGLSKENVEKHEENQACTAYTRYVLDIGQSEDWFALQVAFAPCLLGYGAIAKRLAEDPKTVREGNTYWKWIQNYVAADYTEAVTVGQDVLEKYAVLQSPSRIEELVKIFIHATRMETGFWNMGYGNAQ